MNQKEKRVLSLLSKDRHELMDLPTLASILEASNLSSIRNLLFDLHSKKLVKHKRKRGKECFYISNKGINALYEQHDHVKSQIGNKNYNVLKLLYNNHKKKTLNIIEFGEKSALNSQEIMEKLNIPLPEVKQALKYLYDNGYVEYISNFNIKKYYINYTGFNLFRKIYF